MDDDDDPFARMAEALPNAPSPHQRRRTPRKSFSELAPIVPPTRGGPADESPAEEPRRAPPPVHHLPSVIIADDPPATSRSRRDLEATRPFTREPAPPAWLTPKAVIVMLLVSMILFGLALGVLFVTRQRVGQPIEGVSPSYAVHPWRTAGRAD